MILKSGYWKSENLTDSIVSCVNQQSNCIGNEEQGYCKEGHIGALCEYCDVTGRFWNTKYYSDGSFNCKECSQLTQAKNLVPTIFLGIGMVIYVLISIRIAWDISQLIVIGYYLRKLKFAPVSKSSFSDTTNMNMKAMMNYIQIAQLVNTVKVELPKWLTFFPEYVGSPVQNMIYTLDCYLGEVNQNDIPIIFLRTLWGLSIPFLYLFGMSIIYAIFVKLNWMKHNRAYIYSGLVFLFIFMQPNMISNLLGAMSCREIDGQKYILMDVSFRCYTDVHVKFIAFICIPGILIWGFLIPFFILRKLTHQKQRLDDASLRLVYGFLYQDYKTRNYYWEFVKSYMKIIIVCIYNFYGDPYSKFLLLFQFNLLKNILYLANKLIFSLIVFIFYLVILVKFSPYQMLYFQKIDRNSTVVIITLVIMNIFLYNKPDIAQSQIFYIILLGIHNTYLGFLFFEVVKAKVQISFKKQFDLIKTKLAQYVECLRPFLKVKKNVRLKTFINWMSVRKLLQSIKVEKERGQIRDKIFGISSSVFSSQNNLQSPHIRSSEQLMNREVSKSQFYNQLQGVTDKQQESIKDSLLVVDQTSSKQLDKKQRYKYSLDKSESSNIGQNSLSINNNQTGICGSPLIQGTKYEVCESQYKVVCADQNSTTTKQISIEQMLMNGSNNSYAHFMKDSIIGKNLKRITQSTNASQINQQTQQFFSKIKQMSQNEENQDQKLFTNFLDNSPTLINNSPGLLGECQTNTTIYHEQVKEKKDNNSGNTKSEDIEDDNSIQASQRDKEKITLNIQTSIVKNSYFNDNIFNSSLSMGIENKLNEMQKNSCLDEINESQHKKSIELSEIEQGLGTPQYNEGQDTPQNNEGSDTPQYNQGQDTPQYNTRIDTPQNNQLNLMNDYDRFSSEKKDVTEGQYVDTPTNDHKFYREDFFPSRNNQQLQKNDQNLDLEEESEINESDISQDKIDQLKQQLDDQTLKDEAISQQDISPRQQLEQEIEKDDSFEFDKVSSKNIEKSTNFKNKLQRYKTGGKSVKGQSSTDFNPMTMIMDHQTIYTVDQEQPKTLSQAQGFEQSKVINMEQHNQDNQGLMSSKQDDSSYMDKTEKSYQNSVKLENDLRNNKEIFDQTNGSNLKEDEEQQQINLMTEEDHIVEIGTETINEEIQNQGKQYNKQSTPNDGNQSENFNVLYKDYFSSSPKNDNWKHSHTLAAISEKQNSGSVIDTPRDFKQVDFSDKNSKTIFTQIQDHQTIYSGQNKNIDQEFNN